MSKIEQIKIPVGLEVGNKVGKKACPHKWMPTVTEKERKWKCEDGIWCLVEEGE